MDASDNYPSVKDENQKSVKNRRAKRKESLQGDVGGHPSNSMSKSFTGGFFKNNNDDTMS